MTNKRVLQKQPKQSSSAAGKQVCCAQTGRKNGTQVSASSLKVVCHDVPVVLGLLLCFLLINPTLAVAESSSSSTTPIIRLTGILPEVMAAFAINTNTGDLAAVSPVTNKAYLFRHPQDLFSSSDDGNSTLTAYREATVCKTPVSIAYKNYKPNNKQYSYYAVVCAEEATLHLLDAATLDTVGTTPVGGLGCSSVIASYSNPNDPFFYYIGFGLDPTLAAVDIRNAAADTGTNNGTSSIVVVDQGQVWYDSVVDSAISANGTILYLRSPWSSGLEAVQMTSSFSDEGTTTPTFEQIHYNYGSTTMAYVPDTVGKMTASGRTIYSETLQDELAQLDFYVSAWIQDSSYIVGFWQDAGEYGSMYYNEQDPPIGIALASSSTFESIHSGNNEYDEPPIRIPRGFFDVDVGVNSQADFGDIQFQRALIPIDVHQELLLAYANHISITPYPCMTMAVLGVTANATRIFVGRGPQVIQISISPDDDGNDSSNIFESKNKKNNNRNENQLLELDVLQLPPGATYNSASGLLTWEPTEDQMGTHEIVSSVSFADGGNGACHVALALNVTFPSIQLPILDASLLVVDMNETTESVVVVAWAYYQEQYDYNYQDGTEQVVPAYSRVTAVHLLNQTQRTRDFDYKIYQVLVTGNRIVIVEWPKSGTSTYPIHILNVFDDDDSDGDENGMELLETINLNIQGSSNVYFSIFERQLRVKYGNNIDTYNLETFHRTEQELFSVVDNNRNYHEPIGSDGYGDGAFREGVVRDGILYNPITGAKLAVLDGGPFQLTGPPDVDYSYNNYLNAHYSDNNYFDDDYSYNNYYNYLDNEEYSWLTRASRYFQDQPVVAFYKGDVCLQLEVKVTYETTSSNYYNNNKYSEAILWVTDWDGNVLGSKILQPRTLDPGADEYQNRIASHIVAARDKVFVIYRDQLFWFSADEFSSERLQLAADDGGSYNNESSSVKLRFAPNQTAFCVNGRDEYEFHHTLLGGHGPFDFFLDEGTYNPNNALRFDKATGSIQLDGADFMSLAKQSLAEDLIDRGIVSTEGPTAELLSASRRGSEPSIYLSDCLLTEEFPVSLRLGVTAVDSKGNLASIAYHVIIGVPYDEVMLNNRSSSSPEYDYNATIFHATTKLGFATRSAVPNETTMSSDENSTSSSRGCARLLFSWTSSRISALSLFIGNILILFVTS